jgi:hypothetical protein
VDLCPSSKGINSKKRAYSANSINYASRKAMYFRQKEDRKGQNEAANIDQQKQQRLTRTIDSISKSLSKALFAFNTEVSIDNIGYDYIDYNHEPPKTGGVNGILTGFCIGLEDPKTTLEKISQVKPEKKDILDLALAYYRLCYYDNPIRIQTLFSLMSVLVRDIRHMKIDDDLYAKSLRYALSDILQKEERSFNKKIFEDEWDICYSERNKLSHGGKRKLVKVKKKTNIWI